MFLFDQQVWMVTGGTDEMWEAQQEQQARYPEQEQQHLSILIESCVQVHIITAY
jgi:hypothetical protein